jgi:hypothetical protein
MMVAMLRSGRARAIVVLLFLCAVVCAQTASLALEHREHSSEHCCWLCHIGPLPFLQAGPVAHIAPVVALAWFAPLPEAVAAHETLLSAASSRAPPISFCA